MDKIRLSSEDIEFILHWRDEHKDLVRLGMMPMKSVRIECPDSGYAIIASRNGDTVKLNVNHNGRSIGSLTYEFLENGYCQLVRDRTTISQEDKQAVLTVYCSVMALLVFSGQTINFDDGNEAKKRTSINRHKTTHKTQKCTGVTYILHRGGKAPQLIQKGKHASPSHAFTVRGHLRHLANGKVIWIQPYVKGTGRMKGTTYKLGSKGELK